MISPIVSYNSRIRFFSLVVFIGMCAIIARLYDLQIRQNNQLFELSKKNFTRVEKIISLRGNILDTNGVLLATNRPVIDLYWRASNKPTLDLPQLQTLAAVDAMVGTELVATMTSNGIRQAEKQGKTVLLAHDITFEQLSRITEQFPNNPNLYLSTRFKRHYPQGNMACHILGYLGCINYESEGKMGLEKLLEPELKGEHGEIQKTINSLGKNLEERELKQSLSGANIRTTLDITLQQIAERVFPEQYSGALIVMDPKTGALRALVSRPQFDPNIFLNPINPEQWNELQKQKTFLNRAFNASYPPASLFKLVTISAALEKGIIDPSAVIYCRGYYQFGSRQHWCMHHEGHGQLTVIQALAKSCNVLFFHLGKHLSIDTLADYAHRFGLGKKTNMLFPDNEGLVPTSLWKLTTKRERWWPGETLSAAIGQSFLLVTPIQVARMVASIFEGYLVTPRLLEEEEIVKSPLALSGQTRAFLQQSMRSVVTMGTGIRLSYLSDLEVYAKTGTAQTSSLELREKNEAFSEHGWVATYFKHKNHPSLALVILLEHASSSSVATGIAKEFLVAYRNSHQSEAVSTQA